MVDCNKLFDKAYNIALFQAHGKITFLLFGEKLKMMFDGAECKLAVG